MRKCQIQTPRNRPPHDNYRSKYQKLTLNKLRMAIRVTLIMQQIQENKLAKTNEGLTRGTII